jgi:hypothetical protein
MERTMANEKQTPKPMSADPDLRMDTKLEADPMLRLSEGKASGLRIAIVGLAVLAIVAVVAWAISQP